MNEMNEILDFRIYPNVIGSQPVVYDFPYQDVPQVLQVYRFLKNILLGSSLAITRLSLFLQVGQVDSSEITCCSFLHTFSYIIL